MEDSEWRDVRKQRGRTTSCGEGCQEGESSTKFFPGCRSRALRRDVSKGWRRDRQREFGQRDGCAAEGSKEASPSRRGPWFNRRRSKQRSSQEIQSADRSAEHLARKGHCRRKESNRPDALYDDVNAFGPAEPEEEEVTQTVHRIPWWIQLRRHKRLAGGGKRHACRALPPQVAAPHPAASQEDLHGLGKGDHRRDGDRQWTGLDDQRLSSKTKLGEIQRRVSMCHDGCPSLRVSPCRGCGSIKGSVGAEHESEDSKRDPAGGLVVGVASDRTPRPVITAGVRGVQGGDVGCGRLHQLDQQVAEEGQRKRRRRRKGRRLKSGGVQEPSPGVDPVLEGENSKFLSYFRWLCDAHSTLPVVTGSNVPLFPCKLPYPEAIGDFGAITGLSGSDLWARRHVNTMFAFSNFLVLGCPDCRGNTYEPQGSYQSCDFARQFADGILGEVAEFGSSSLIADALNCSGSRVAVEEIFEEASKQAGPYMKLDDGGSLSGALPVVASRVAMPAAAGTVDPLQFLDHDKREVVADLSRLRLPEHLWPEIPVACHRVPKEEEAGLVQKLLDHGMVRLLPESELPHDKHGRLLCGGFFCVPKNSSEDRLIFDRRPENSTMERIVWAKLPAGACFTRMLLEPHQYIRGSGDDLRNFYYTLKLPDSWVKYNSVGRRVDAKVVQAAGGDPTIPHRMCLRVLGMGDTNACDIAQATHESILQSKGLLGTDTRLEYGQHVPPGDIWDGVYLDDLLVVMKCLADRPIDPSTFKPPAATGDDLDMKRMAVAEQAYAEAGLLRAEHKAFRAEVNFKAWGAEVKGLEGTVGAPLDFRRQVWKLLQRIIKLGWCTKRILQKLLGYTCFIFQYRRELFALQHHIYKFVQRLPNKGWRRLPVFICDELRSMAYYIPVARWNMRKQLSPSLLATDATPTSGGAARVDATPELCKELWRQSEVRGSAVRLDSRPIDEVLDWDAPDEPSVLASVLGHALPWKATSSYTFRQTSHINLQEARALKKEVSQLCSDLQQRGSIQICFNDSRVVCGAFSKGRSSSFKLNGVMRSLVPYLVAGDITLAFLWIETHANPADHPSRFVAIPAPSLHPKWLQKFCRPGHGNGWEIFAGTCRLTKAHEQLGVPMVWLAPPCGTFSPLRNLDIGGPLRPRGNPYGDPNVLEVFWGNKYWRRALLLANLCHKRGIYFFIEHPCNSKAWQWKETQALLCKAGVYSIVLDWCMFEDPERVGQPNRKPTRIMTSSPWLRSLVRRCDHSHVHGPPLRGKRAKLAGAYPWEFCWELAKACKGWYKW